MKLRDSRNLLARIMALATVAGLSTLGLAQAGGMSAEETFQIGGSCAGLAYLNKGQISMVLSAAFSDDLHSFCYPEEPSECADYSAFLQGAGKLTTGDDDFHCSLNN